MTQKEPAPAATISHASSFAAITPFLWNAINATKNETSEVATKKTEYTVKT
jgi:hypothetical protein